LDKVSKLCLQYINPIIKNRIYNYIPAGLNPFVGTQARPSEITYSEDRLRPGYTPPAPPDAPAPDGPPPPGPPPPADQPPPADAPGPPPGGGMDPTQVLQNLMLPTGPS
jgi:phospholipid/cholesterol/gamma-HCH transport system substrate-binding protein